MLKNNFGDHRLETISQYIFFYAPQHKEINSGLEQHEGVNDRISRISFLSEPSLRSACLTHVFQQ